MNYAQVAVSVLLFCNAHIVAFRIMSSARRSNKLFFTASDAFADKLTAADKALLKAATEAANRAGKAMLAGSGTIDLSTDVESKIGSRDVVTEVDKKCQDLIKDSILAHFPSHKFLGEEDVAPGIEASKAAIASCKDEQHLWIVDPIDGTTNFAHGQPLSGVIIAYASYGVTQFGLIYDPFQKELFTAFRGKGAYLNNERIHCCKTRSLSESVIATGSPPNFKSLDACLRATTRLSPKVRTMRMLGSAAIMLSWVAIGRLTAYFEADLNVWDLAAGCLIIEEAGGRVTDTWGKPYGTQSF